MDDWVTLAVLLLGRGGRSPSKAKGMVRGRKRST